MGPKLKEMDAVIEKIHSSITLTQEINQRGTLLVRAALFSYGIPGAQLVLFCMYNKSCF